MANQDIHTHYSALIARYLSGNASASETEELEAWVLAAPEHKEQFMTFKKAWMLAGMQQTEDMVNVNALWEQTSQQLFEEGKVIDIKASSNRFKWLGIAAAIALLLAVSFWLFRPAPKDLTQLVQTTEESKTFDLADGSTITLNQSSSLAFTPAGKSPQRKVVLDGDAFFEVERDEAHPFIIEAQGVEIEVLGTSFYVDARKDQAEIQVIVESGSVAVRSNTAETILTANEKAVFQKQNNHLSKQQNEDVNFLAVKTKTLVFEEARLEAVIFALNRQYHARISIGSEALKDCLLDATFTDKSLSTILKVLEASFGITATQEGQAIVLSGECSTTSPE